MVIFGLIVGAIYYQLKRDEHGIQNRFVFNQHFYFLSFLVFFFIIFPFSLYVALVLSSGEVCIAIELHVMVIGLSGVPGWSPVRSVIIRVITGSTQSC